LLGRLNERADIAGEFGLELLDTLGPSTVVGFSPRLDLGHDHHRHAVLDRVVDRGLACELHYYAALGQWSDLLDELAVLIAPSPRLQRRQ